MANRTPQFEMHIRPMMRRLDRDAMVAARSFDLWSYDDVRNKAPKILNRLKRGIAGSAGAMPPPGAGGPWPEEWVALFERWIDAGFPRLDMASGTYAVTRISSSVLSLSADGSNPTSDFATWLEPDFEPAEPLQFVLFREPAASGGTSLFSASIDFSDTGVRTLTVADRIGRHRIDFPNA